MEFQQGENIWIASSDGDLARVCCLLSNGVDVNAQDDSGYSPIHAAVSYGHMNLLQFLVEEQGANVRLKDGDGDEPIMFCETPEIFEYLVSHGADPTVVNDAGQTLFDVAAEDENDAMVTYLVNKGLGNRDPENPITMTVRHVEEEEESNQQNQDAREPQ